MQCRASSVKVPKLDHEDNQVAIRFNSIFADDSIVVTRCGAETPELTHQHTLAGLE